MDIKPMEQVKNLEPVIRKYSNEAEKNRTLAEPVIKALKESGLYRIWRPSVYGGLEADPITGFEVVEELSKIDSTVGWNLNLSLGIETIMQWFPENAHAEVYSSNEEVIFAGTWHPPGRAFPVNDGFEVTGQWNIVSGCRYATWFLVNSMIMEGEQPRMLENGHPELLLMLVPRKDIAIVETWNTIGMKGTGSHDIALEKVFIPAHRAVDMLPIEKANGSGFRGSLYNNTVWYAISCIAAPALGIARAAIDDTMELIKNKIPNYTETKLKDLQSVQMKLAESEATLRAARAYLYDEVKFSWERAKMGKRITMDGKVRLQIAATFAMDACLKSVRNIHDIAGLTGMRESHPIERHFRDIHTLRQHAFTSAARYQSVGQIMLGLEPNWGFFHF